MRRWNIDRQEERTTRASPHLLEDNNNEKIQYMLEMQARDVLLIKLGM